MSLLGGVMAAGVLALAVYVSLSSGIDRVSAQDVVYFRIGAGTPGSTFYGIAGQIAGIISNPPGSRECDGEGACGVEGLLGLAQTTVTPADSLQSLHGQSLEAAIVSADIADAAFHGIGPFKADGAMTDLRAIANIGQQVLHVIVAKDSKATDIKDLAGKRIAIGAKDSDNAVTAQFLLRAAGLTDKKTKMLTGEFSGIGADLLGGRVDAVALVEKVPCAEVAALMASGHFRLLPGEISADNTAEFVFAEWIPIRQYAGVDATRAIAVPTVLVARADLPAQIAGGLVRALWRSAVPATPDEPLGSIMPNMTRASLPWHPAAAAAFAELSQSTPATLESQAPTN